jgi:hypothetical protein
MAAHILKASREADGYHFQVHLDDTQLKAPGVPLPEWVREWTWPNLTSGIHQVGEETSPGVWELRDQTEDEYLAGIRDLLPGLIQQEIAVMQPPASAPITSPLDGFHGLKLDVAKE